MVSILIPTYNCACLRLCERIEEELERDAIDGEVIVMDDVSDDERAKEENERIGQLAHCRYVSLCEKAGIARIRNMLADEAKGETLVFLDSDVFPVKERFVRRYLEAIDGMDLLCGGLTYRLDGPVKVCAIRYAYGMRYETAHTHFMSLNFCIRKDVFNQIRFDEEFSQYGHEDTLFGMEVRKKGFRQMFIDNEVYHDNVDTGEEYLAKTRRAIENLATHEEKLIGASRLLQTRARLRRWKTGWVFAAAYRFFGWMMERNIAGESPRLWVFNLYRAGYLCSL